MTWVSEGRCQEEVRFICGFERLIQTLDHRKGAQRGWVLGGKVFLRCAINRIWCVMKHIQEITLTVWVLTFVKTINEDNMRKQKMETRGEMTKAKAPAWSRRERENIFHGCSDVLPSFWYCKAMQAQVVITSTNNALTNACVVGRLSVIWVNAGALASTLESE
ncbi:hypothetical protein GALMADRAFT_217320 [Galerina marginata CBS 339.88]|uniref:Uncharacterized protein n=1 Tax=Galerina marginata (strain CBS 339.88) TaxID=685588 RepID=A0A067S7F3_GALM3|nr:hypothetical protein GALMADRAFT_217320 [Galerina marginata CBS 339.88]